MHDIEAITAEVDERGYCCVPNVISPEQADAARTALHRLLDEENFSSTPRLLLLIMIPATTARNAAARVPIQKDFHLLPVILISPTPIPSDDLGHLAIHDSLTL